MGAGRFLLAEPDTLGHDRHPGWALESNLAGRFATTSVGSLSVTHSYGFGLIPNFTLALIVTILFALLVLGFIWWRFGGPDTLAFIIVSGVFTAIMDFISSFVVQNYEYPGQSPLWVFTYIFFGWIGMCGSCLFVAEGILARPGQDMLTQPRLWWQAALLTSLIAVVMDLFIDPVATAAGYWVWLVQGTVYYGIPLLNFVGWLVLMFLSPLAWICIGRHRQWHLWHKVGAAIGVLVPLFIASVLLSLVLNGAIAALGLQ